MKKILKILVPLAVAGAMLGTLVGCGSNKSQPEPKSEANKTGEASETSKSGGTISIMVPATSADKQLKWDQDVVQEFNETNSEGVTAELQTYEMEQYKTKLTTLMATNTMADVFLTWELDFLKPFVKGDKVLELDSYLEADPEWKNRFESGVLDPLAFDGKTYGVPSAKAICVMFYNKEVFEKAGVKVPTTSDEFLAACEKLKAVGTVPMTMAGKDSWIPAQFLQQIANGIGGKKVYDGLISGETAWNNESFVQAGEAISSMVKKGYFQDGYLGMGEVEARKLFLDGKAAMYFMGTWDAATCDAEGNAVTGKVGAFAMPAKDPANNNVLVGSIDKSFAVAANSKNPKAAVELLKMFSDKKYQEQLTYDYGNIPTSKLEVDESKISKLTSDVLHISSAVTNLTPWFDRAFGGGSSKEQFDALDQFAKDNANR